MLQKLKKIFGKEALESSVSCGNSEKEGCSCDGLKVNEGLKALTEEQNQKPPLYSKKEGCSCHGLKHNEKLKALAEEKDDLEEKEQQDKKPPLYSEKEGCSCHGLKKE